MRFSKWYQHLDDDEDSDSLENAFHDLFRPTVAPIDPAELCLSRPMKATKAMARHVRERYQAKRAELIVMKDPIALLSTEWLVRHFAVRPVIMIRHPAAFVSSIKLKNWFFDFNNLLSQPDAIETFFPEEREIIEQITLKDHHDVVVEAAIQWRILHKAILKFRQLHPEWLYLRHEDLSLDPLSQFARVFSEVELPMSSRVKKFIEQTSTDTEKLKALRSTPASDVVRHSASNVMAWKQRLSIQEIHNVRDIVGETASEFYSDFEW